MFKPDPAPQADPADWRAFLVPQRWARFTPAEHGVWDTLLARQMPYLEGRIAAPFLDGVAALGLDQPGIPDLAVLNARLEPLTGWRCVSVPGLVPDDVFFAMLSERAFPIGNFIRGADSLDYLEQPDCFHDIFGHVPMLAQPSVARLMQALGRLGVEAIAAGHGDTIARLYWHTVEFGLVREGGATKILGAGLASSFGEAHYSLEDDLPRLRFTPELAAATPYRSDRFQPLYLVADSLEAVAAQLETLDLAGLTGLQG